MTKKEYLLQKFSSLGFECSDADLLDMQIKDPQQEASQDTYKAFILFIPQLLLRPNSISEAGTSISRATKDEIIALYKAECKRLGLPDELSERKPKVKFI